MERTQFGASNFSPLWMIDRLDDKWWTTAALGWMGGQFNLPEVAEMMVWQSLLNWVRVKIELNFYATNKYISYVWGYQEGQEGQQIFFANEFWWNDELMGWECLSTAFLPDGSVYYEREANRQICVKHRARERPNTRTVKDPQAKIHKHTVEDGYTNTQEGASNPVILTKTLIQGGHCIGWLWGKDLQKHWERGETHTPLNSGAKKEETGSPNPIS